MREKLIELIKSSLMKHIGKSCNLAENIADDLLPNGVVVLPCKVGDVVYVIDNCEHKARIDLMFGRTVFLTKEEAEKAIERRNG